MRTLIGTWFEIHVGHKLFHHKGECSNAHGHTYKVEVEAEGEIDPLSGMVIDFEKFRSCIGSAVQRYDHAFLVNAEDGLDPALHKFLGAKVMPIDGEPTAEALAHLLAARCFNLCKGMGISLRRVRVWETRHCYACVEM